MRLVDASGGIRDGPTSLLWDSKIELSEKFFNEIIRHPVPLNMNTLTALKCSPLGLDLYLWLVYRTFALRAPKRLTWRLLYSQFGVEENPLLILKFSGPLGNPPSHHEKVAVQATRPVGPGC